ncbi:MAG: peptidoglycan-associated lipoprotein Pal [Rhodospirillales bacterium]|nr:peptidoglycan-associated lipoprotein Pal [Alphaproteobacteria bacterium]MBL6947897.1 peptidoglycan-associated lipoprotein Pal [Rhodospirillales bacterium]
MRYKILGLFAAIVLVSACESASTGGAAGGSGVAGAKPVETFSAPLGTGITPGSQEDLVVSVGDRVFFDFDKYNLKTDARQTLDRQAAWLKANPSVTFTIEGHCDERGTREYNLALGERRANSVKDYLASQGINPARMKTISYGKERPVAVGSTNAAWAQNRRGVTRISGAGS